MQKKLIIVIICAAIAAVGFFGGKYFYDVAKYKSIVADIEVRTPDLSQIPDGVYNGSFNAILAAADVDVTMQDHRITGIVINEHYNDRGAKAEIITESVIAQQSLEVDTVSGATNSSKVILKAVENALVSEAIKN